MRSCSSIFHTCRNWATTFRSISRLNRLALESIRLNYSIPHQLLLPQRDSKTHMNLVHLIKSEVTGSQHPMSLMAYLQRMKMMGHGRRRLQGAHESQGTLEDGALQRFLYSEIIHLVSNSKIQVLLASQTQKLKANHLSSIRRDSLWTIRQFSREALPSWAAACEELLRTRKWILTNPTWDQSLAQISRLERNYSLGWHTTKYGSGRRISLRLARLVSSLTGMILSCVRPSLRPISISFMSQTLSFRPRSRNACLSWMMWQTTYSWRRRLSGVSILSRMPHKAGSSFRQIAFCLRFSKPCKVMLPLSRRGPSTRSFIHATIKNGKYRRSWKRELTWRTMPSLTWLRSAITFLRLKPPIFLEINLIMRSLRPSSSDSHRVPAN